MDYSTNTEWQASVVSPSTVLDRIRPGMNIFLDTGAAEPRTFLKHLMTSDIYNAKDLELIQIASYGDTLSLKELQANKYRLKTFFSGWVDSRTIASERVDLCSGRFSQIARVFESWRIPIDVAVVQITPPNHDGYCSLGISMDVAREAMEQASLVVGEINPHIPFTLGVTLVPVSDFDLLIQSSEGPIYFPRPETDEIHDRIAANVASVIRDGDCINFSTGPLFEALSHFLVHKRHLGVHSPYITDALMDLLRSGAVTNYRKVLIRGKSAVSFAHGTAALMQWLDRNPLVEFQRIDLICNPTQLGRNHNFVALFQASKVDLLGGIAFPVSPGPIATGPSDAVDLVMGAENSSGGRTVFGIPSRDAEGNSNVLLTLADTRNQFRLRDSVNIVVSEYGIANLKWRTIRERAQALIDIAHPDDREDLIAQAKARRILYADQIFLSEAARFYPVGIVAEHSFKGGVKIRFRAIKPSDEASMRRLFYRFSDKSVLYRYLFPIKTMPHYKVQHYVNVDYRQVMSIVGIVGDPGDEKIIAEARFDKDEESVYGDLGFVVDENYQSLGIASYLYAMLVRLARERGLQGLKAEVLRSNKAMLNVFQRNELPVHIELEGEVYKLTMPFDLDELHPSTAVEGPGT